ncbi:hypothetical protein [Brevibacillus dissolubilis]|uniref:hypothetical protein n=1 Tax=Brevibacillus dissolubilis TaxID=1844116 RepID=UPI0011162142|nr:hypothetical protein [Brevibacillus dissolubilis]
MWDGWPLERVLLIFAGLAFLLIFVQVYMFHSRQNFRHWAMWIPVIATPVFTVATITYAFYAATWLFYVLVVLMIAGAAAGLYGAYLHTVGVGQRVGGYSQTQNFLVGPPVILPLLITAISALGLLALFWG